MTPQQPLQEILENPKLAAVVGGVTTATGVGAYVDAISQGLGIIATLCGITLSCVLIYKHVTDIINKD